MVRGLGLDRQPALLLTYFGNYRRVVYLAQTEDPDLQAMARRHADYLGLEYHYRPRGDEPLSLILRETLVQEEACPG